MMRKKIINLMTATLVVALSGVNMYASTEPSAAVGTPRADATWKSAAVAYGATAFDKDNGALYLGAKTTFAAAAVAPYSLAKVTLSSDDGTAVFTPLAPDADCVDWTDGVAAKAAVSPLQSLTNFQVTLTPAGLPVVAMKAANGTDDQAWVYLVNDTDAGKEITSSDNGKLFDGNAGGNPTVVTKAPVALAASDNYIFAAVNKHDVATWGDPTNDQCGIAIIDKQTEHTLKPVRAIDITAAPDAAVNNSGARQIIMTAADDTLADDGKIAFKPAAGGIGAAELSDGVSMVWDDTLSRLYVGLSGVKRDDPYKEGGVVDILVGDVGARVANQFNLGPVVYDLPKACLYNDAGAATEKNADNAILGFYFDNTNLKTVGGAANAAHNYYDDVALSARKLHVMHTSTKKSYLILNGVAREPAVMVHGGLISQSRNGVYALPLLGTQKWVSGTTYEDWGADDATKARYIGMISKVDANVATFNDWTASLAEMPRESHAAVKVGGGYVSTVNLQDIYTVGDSVYMFMGGSNNAEAGIFQSTALFNENGIIFGWTPATRIGGDVERAFGGGINPATGELYFLASLDNAVNPNKPTAYNNQISAPRVSKWGKSGAYQTQKMSDAGGYENRTLAANGLSTQLDTIFDAANPLHHVIDFNNQTLGFRTGRFSMAVALSDDKIALIQTGEWTNGMFKPTKDFSSSVFDLSTATYDPNGVLATIAPLCHATIAYLAASTQAWLFVAGYNGVAVLSLAGAANNGFKNLATLNDAANGSQTVFPGDNDNWKFKQLSTITGVRKVVADNVNNGVYVMCDSKIYWIPLAAGSFDTVDHAAALTGGAAVTYDLSDTHLTTLTLTNYHIRGLADMVYVGNGVLLVAADTGLFAVEVVGADVANIKQFVTEPVVHLNYLSTDAQKPSATGNVYAMVANYAEDSAKIYRYYVNSAAADIADAVKSILSTPLVCTLPGFSLNVTNDGTTALVSRPYETDLVDYVNLTASTVTYDDNFASTTLNADETINLTTKHNIGVPGLNSASGTWTIPGDFGVRVNE